MVLLAVCGTSPAVLTETVWALAHPQDGGPAAIPEEVVAITTLKGKDAIQQQLQKPLAPFGGRTVWQALRYDVLGARASQDTRLTLVVEVIRRSSSATGAMEPLGDIRSGEDSLAAAQFILQLVRQHTAAEDRALIASLAGGRKTMSALLHAAVSHLGRPGDRLTHILVNEGFETEGFFFPTQPHQSLRTRDGTPLKAAEACLELTEVPFAPLRLRFPDIAQIPTRFEDLVRTYSEAFRRDASVPAAIELLQNPPRVVVDGVTVKLEGSRQLTVITFLLEANQQKWVEKDQVEAAEIFKAWHGYQPQLDHVRQSRRDAVKKLFEERKASPGDHWIAQAAAEDIKRPLSFLRRELEARGATWKPLQRDLRLPLFRLVGKTQVSPLAIRGPQPSIDG
ncbi:conserved hypothetical protein [Verrucomicrobia bacterium]|nr:conserved hypothetical protein [Verrucomicrobiota bacterium]